MVEGIAAKEDEQFGEKNGGEMEEDEDEEERGREIIEKCGKCLFRALNHLLNSFAVRDGDSTYLCIKQFKVGSTKVRALFCFSLVVVTSFFSYYPRSNSILNFCGEKTDMPLLCALSEVYVNHSILGRPPELIPDFWLSKLKILLSLDSLTFFCLFF